MSARSGGTRVRRGLLLVAPATMAVVLAGPVSPAAAHPPVGSVEVVGPDGEPLEATATEEGLSVRGLFRHSNPDAPLVESIDLRATAADVDPDCPEPDVPDLEGEPATRAFTVALPPFACNGTWILEATGSTGEAEPVHGREQGRASDTFALALAPADPVGLESLYVDEPSRRRSVTLSWAANPEPDIVGYRVERLAPGAEVYAVLGLAPPNRNPRFVDGELTAEGEHTYRLTALRAGATSAAEDRVASAGADETVIDVPAPRATTTTTTGGGASPAGTSSPAPAGAPGTTVPGGSPASPPTTRDTGFVGTLPFDSSQTTTSIVPGGPVDPAATATPPPGDAAVVALDEGGDGGEGAGTLLVPVAVSLALLVGAAHVRLVLHRAGQAEEVITPL